MAQRRDKWVLSPVFCLVLTIGLGWFSRSGSVPLLYAQAYPTKGIQLIVPFPPGGSTDLTGRVVANYLSKKWEDGIREAMKDPRFLEKMERIGADAAYLGPNEFKALLQEQYQSALRIAEKLGLRK